MQYFNVVESKAPDGVLLIDSEDDRVVARGHLEPQVAMTPTEFVAFEVPVMFVGSAAVPE
jgi:hypothetical protein